MRRRCFYFLLTPDKRQRNPAQTKILTQLQQHVNSIAWAKSQADSGMLPASVTNFPSMASARKSGKPRKPLGPGLPAVGLINGDKSIEDLVELMHTRKRQAESRSGVSKRRRSDEEIDD